MSDSEPRNGWLLPVLLAVTTTAALGFGFLYLTRPNAGELGQIKVTLQDDTAAAGKGLTVVVAEGPLVQKDTVAPGPEFTGVVHYESPYLVLPNLKIKSEKRHYDILEQTERGFTWAARLLPEDRKEGAAEENGFIKDLLGSSVAIDALRGNLKPGLGFEEFTWEARGIRAPLSAIPPKTFEQTGSFATAVGQEGIVAYPIPYSSPPNVALEGGNGKVIVTDCTATTFKWKNTGADAFFDNREATWTSKGVLGSKPAEKPEPAASQK